MIILITAAELGNVNDDQLIIEIDDLVNDHSGNTSPFHLMKAFLCNYKKKFTTGTPVSF